ncbi:hypothetical protein EG329_003786 [Mollisiaceae sp. DMI_Dod_QoI]|nr:hypothetical protein EG329_003786 [Helotiales sp. DMI_Dod_QoI]
MAVSLVFFVSEAGNAQAETVIEPLGATSLSKHARIVDGHRDNTSAAKDGQHASQSLGGRPATEDHPDDASTAGDQQRASQSSGDRLATEDHPDDISTVSDGHDANAVGDPPKEGSTPGYRHPLTQEDTDFCAAVLFCKQFLEMERTQGNRNQESKPLFSRVSGFWKANAPKANSDPNSQITAVDDISMARPNNQGIVRTNDSPASAKKALAKSLQSSDTIEGDSKHTQHRGGRYKPRHGRAPKRVLSEVCKTTGELQLLPIHKIQPANWNFILVVILDSDGEEEMEITTADDSYGARPTKRLRLAKENKAVPVTARSSSLEGSVKASDDEAKGRRRSPTRTRVTAHEFKDHLNTEATWLNTASTRCKALRKFLTEQRQHIATLDALDTEQCQIVAELSADRLPRSTRLQLIRELGDLEERRSKAAAGLRQATKSASSEGAAMKQDLEQWDVTEKKVTERIERSR